MFNILLVKACMVFLFSPVFGAQISRNADIAGNQPAIDSTLDTDTMILNLSKPGTFALGESSSHIELWPRGFIPPKPIPPVPKPVGVSGGGLTGVNGRPPGAGIPGLPPPSKPPGAQPEGYPPGTSKPDEEPEIPDVPSPSHSRGQGTPTATHTPLAQQTGNRSSQHDDGNHGSLDTTRSTSVPAHAVADSFLVLAAFMLFFFAV